LSFASPENVQFRYQLSGFDADWVEAGNRRSATYPHLPAGDYEFRVFACNHSGVWSTNQTVLALTATPFFHETVWFKLGVGLVTVLFAGGLTYAFSRARYRRRLRQLEARIARDIHDELGSSLTRIVMLSQPDEADVAAARPEMKRIYETARNLTRTMDEVVWAVNPRQDSLEGLTAYLTAFAQEFTSAANVACRLDLPERLPVVALSAEVRHNLFLAAKEAMHNAVRHGRAQVITIALSIQPHAFILTISDDGIGFQVGTPASPRHGHGLENMRARLAGIGGECDITTRPQAGTTIRFTVPLDRAGVSGL
jgi:signal transduction histidine kinase